MNTRPDVEHLEKQLGYRFDNTDLIYEALRHSSFVNEQMTDGLGDNERLEFLGDAVLNLAVGHLLMRRFPDISEGDLSRVRANLVSETGLAALARQIDLGRCIQLGKGETQTGGQEKNSILADAFEAVVAALYLEAGFEHTFSIIGNLFKPMLAFIDTSQAGQDYKSRLQEIVQAAYKEVPRYRIESESGPDHEKTFDVVMTAGPLRTRGSGKSKKLAEQDAARNALAQLEGRPARTRNNSP